MAKILLIGNYRPSLTIARVLSAAGHEVWAATSGYCDYLNWSRAVMGSLPISDFEHGLAALEDIGNLVRRHGFDAVWPVSDQATRYLARHGASLPDGLVRVSPDPALVSRCVSKTEMAALCADLDVPVAPFTAINSVQEAREACLDLGFPVVIKPTSEGELIHGKKVLTLHGLSDLDAELASWPKGHTQLLAQKRLDGQRHNHYFLAHRGKLISGAALEILRTDRADGSGYAVEGISAAPRPDLADHTARLVEALGYTGLGCAQYMTSRVGSETSFLEVNPRLGANFAGAEAAGAHMVNAALDLALGHSETAPANPWAKTRTGVRYAWSKGDLSGWLWRMKHGASLAQTISDAATGLITALRADTHLVFDWRDPAPALGCALHPILKRFAPESRSTPRLKRAV